MLTLLIKMEKHIPENAESTLIFYVNGKKIVESKPDPECTLLTYLRRKLQLTGTKYGCGEGGCGACTVMLSQYIPLSDSIKHIAINACLTPVCSLHGMAITTIEGIGSVDDKLHPVQERIAKAHGSQCGFCTPGFVMSMYTLLRNKEKIVYEDIEVALQGNLCRCTGYRPIIEGFKTFAMAWQSETVGSISSNKSNCALGENCCKNNPDNTETKLFDETKFKPYDPSQEPIFPPELKVNYRKYQTFLYYKGESVVWVRPTNLKEAIHVKQAFPETRIVNGNTEIGVEMKIKNLKYPVLLSPNALSELNKCEMTDKAFLIGATVTLTDLLKYFETVKLSQDRTKTKFIDSIMKMLHYFAGTQVRNVASLAGNIITASPISDLNPILMACGASVHIASNSGHKKVPIDSNFFVNYRKTIINSDELLLYVEIPFSKESQHFNAFKQARRNDDDISIVTAAFNVTFENNTVIDAKLCYGGMGPKTISADETSNIMLNKQWHKELLMVSLETLNKEFSLDISVPGGMAEYRKSLCLSLFFKFFIDVSNNYLLNKNGSIFNKSDMPILNPINYEPKSSQYFESRNLERKLTDCIGLPVTHVSALKQSTGEALYCDDIPQTQGELYLSLVFSAKAHANIVSIDASEATALDGVIAFLSAVDIDSDCNKLGPIFKDEEIFSTKTVTSRACVIGAIVAVNEIVAKKAKQLVKVNYEDLDPVITIEEAISSQSYLSEAPRVLKNGDIKKAFADADHILESHIRTGAQEHFYLETFCSYANRKEDELEIISSTQNPAEMAALAAHALKIPNHKVVAKTKRIGGGFGGKETRSAILAIPVVIAAYKLKRPVRSVLDRDEDMLVTGTRHPVLIKYKVAFNNDGKILGVKFDVYSNAGNSMDISCSMNERIVTHLDNCYSIPNIEINAYLCKTNLPSNTAFRGFGAPQSMFATENMIRNIAYKLGKSYEEIAEINFYREGQLTHFNQALEHCTISRCWNECKQMSDYWKRKEAVEEFNKQNRWKKRGLTLVPTKYGISFQNNFLMQAGCLLMVYTDGSVLLSIGGIEMGQGLFTKMIQVASKALDIDISKIHISEMATDKVPNSSPTAGSVSSDIYGMAVIDACKTILERLKPYQDPSTKWEDWIINAYFDRVNLSATGFYAAPEILYDIKTNSGHLFEYFTYGAACTEVEIDCLTGNHSVIRTDIVMDLGESLNPAIDVGQVEGAFMQGYGLFVLEELVYSPSGMLLSRGPGAYKIPAISDIPKEFNVSLLKGAPNPRAVYASKAVGEPPLFLAASVLFSIKDAISSARKDSGECPEFQLDAPATCEKIRMACIDTITKLVRFNVFVDHVKIMTITPR